MPIHSFDSMYHQHGPASGGEPPYQMQPKLADQQHQIFYQDNNNSANSSNLDLQPRQVVSVPRNNLHETNPAAMST